MTKMSGSDVTKMQISRIEKEIRDTPYHKGTEHHIGRLRAKLSKLTAEIEEKQNKKGGGGGGYAVKKQGDATIVLVGPPSVGKSTLLNTLTNAKSKIAPYAFTTVTVIPGMMEYNNAKIQILDVPGLIKGAEEGKGRGREVLSVVRGASLLMIMTDVNDLEAFDRITHTLEKNGIRINKHKPDVRIEKKPKGGLQVISNISQDLDKETIESVAKEFGYGNAEITIREKLTMESLIDSFARNREYIPAIRVLNKTDSVSNTKKLMEMHKTYKIDVGISADKSMNLDELKKVMWDKLNFITVFLVRQDTEPSNKNPIVLTRGITFNEVMGFLGSEFSEDKTKAKIWGPGAKFPGQTVSLKRTIEEGMMIRFV